MEGTLSLLKLNMLKVRSYLEYIFLLLTWSLDFSTKQLIWVLLSQNLGDHRTLSFMNMEDPMSFSHMIFDVLIYDHFYFQ